MKNRLVRLSLLFVVAVSIIACTNSKEKLNTQISELESQLTGNLGDAVDSVAVIKMTSLYLEYAELYPEDTLSANYLFKAGDISSKIGKVEQSISIFDELISKYPENRNAPYGLFLQGFIYENQVGDPLKAKPYYEKFLQLYPDHPISGDVSFSLENLGKTPEELILEFEKNAATDSVEYENQEPV